jgi:hypothetical protein
VAARLCLLAHPGTVGMQRFTGRPPRKLEGQALPGRDTCPVKWRAIGLPVPGTDRARKRRGGSDEHHDRRRQAAASAMGWGWRRYAFCSGTHQRAF